MAHAGPYDSQGTPNDDDNFDIDSALGADGSLLATSVSTSVFGFKYENGRRYHAYSEGKYPVPNDDLETDRLNLQHEAFRVTLDGALYIAPIKKDVKHVLDVGTGTGIWAVEFASDHPGATVIGTDLSPIQPSDIPENCSFLIDDSEKDWVFSEKFDFIHARALVVALKDWQRFFDQAYANLEPGGYLEVQDFFFPSQCFSNPDIDPEKSPFLYWAIMLPETASRLGLDLKAPGNFGPMLKAAGFSSIRAYHYQWPIGTWAKGEKQKLLGHLSKADLKELLPSASMAMLTRVLGWEKAKVDDFLKRVWDDIESEKELYYGQCMIWVAQKPEEGAMVSPDEEVVFESPMPLEIDVKTPTQE